MDGINPCPCPHLHPAVFASLLLVPSVKTLLAMVATPPANSTMQVVLEDGVEVGGEVLAAMVAEVVDRIVVLSQPLEQQHLQQVHQQQTEQAQPDQVPQQTGGSTATGGSAMEGVRGRRAGSNGRGGIGWSSQCPHHHLCPGSEQPEKAGDGDGCDGIGTEVGVVVKGITPPED